MSEKLTFEEVLAAWKAKLPNIKPTRKELSVFALGMKVGRNERTQPVQPASVEPPSEGPVPSTVPPPGDAR